MESMRFIRVLLSLLLVFSCGSGFAHQTKLSSSLLKIDGSSVRGEVEVNVLDLEAALDTILFNRDTSLDLEAIEIRSDAIFNYVAINNRLYCDSVAQVPTKFGDFRFDG